MPLRWLWRQTRYRMAYDSELTTAILNTFVRVVFGELRRRAKKAFGLSATQGGSQILHRYMRGDLASPHALLHRFGKLFDQRQAARDPADAAIETAR